MSAETSSVNLDKEDKEDEAAKTDESASTKLSEDDAKELCAWLQSTLGMDKVKEVKTTTRLSDSPAIVTDHESGALRKMLRMVVSENLFL